MTNQTDAVVSQNTINKGNVQVPVYILVLGAIILLFVGGGVGAAITQIPRLFVPTPEERYRQEMSVVISQLDDWENGPVEELSGILSGNVVTISVCIDVPPACSEKDRKFLRDEVLPVATSVSEKGFDLRSSIEAAVPTQSLSTSHKQVLACVEYRMNLASGMVDFISTGRPPSFDSGNSPCTTSYRSAVKKISEFIDGK